MSRNLERKEVTVVHCKTAEYGLVRVDSLHTAHTALTTIPRLAMRHSLKLTAHWHVAHCLWPHVHGEAMALHDWTISKRDAYIHAMVPRCHNVV